MFRRNILKILILLSTGYAVAIMMHWPIAFTFFTLLSNIYVAAVVLMQLLSGGRKYRVLKYSAAVSICITFLVYLFVLAPMMPGGILAGYRQDHYSSLCLHLITPALTIADFFLNDADGVWEKKHVFAALIPPALYLVFILVLGKLGVRWGAGRMIAPYLFLNYEAPAGWFGFIPQTANYTTLGIGVFYCILALLLLFTLIAWLFLSIARAAGKRSKKE
ncbi:MAG: Pr6Pr family membrane protein [Oscillospiraceae bacterium]|nr:Pr6Pr family membrane protein [Oscillospiraceae bacterium]